MTVTLLLILLAIFALVLSALSSGLETGVYALNRVRLRVESDREEPRAKLLARMLQREEDLVITTLAGTNVADYLSSATVTALLIHMQVGASWAEVYATAILTPLILVFGGIIPKDLFRRRGDQLMPRFATALFWGRAVLGAIGLLSLLRGISSLALRLAAPNQDQSEILPRARMQRLLIEGAAGGGLSTFQRDTINRVMQLRHVRVREIMVRRERAAFVPIDMKRDDLLRIARMSHFSRLPVYSGRSRDVVGVLNVFDVLMDQQAQPIREHVRAAVLVPANESVPAALLRLQRSHQTMGIVIDERDKAIGLFTMKDLVECIVGEFEAW